MATLTGELISETYDSLLKVTDNNTITGVKKRITDGFGNEIPLQLSSTDIEIDGTLILSALTDLEVATKFLSLKADNSVAYRTASEVLTDIGGASSSSISGTTGNIAKFTSSGAVGDSILEEIGNAIHLTDGTSSYASFGIINPGIDNDCYIGSTINNDFIIRVNNTEALRIDTALRLKITNIQNALYDTDKFLVSEDGVIKYRTGAELLADIGAQGALTLTTSGSSGEATLIGNTLNIPNYSTDLSGYVTLNTAQTITASKTFSTSGGDNTLVINHSSGSGIALSITKGGNGEGIYVNKTSGSGNAVTIIGTLNATTLVKNGGTSSQFLKADGSVDSTAYGTGTVTSVAALTLGTSGYDLNSTVENGTTTPVITLNVPTASSINRGALSSSDWTTFNNKQNALTNPVTGTGTTNYLPKFTGTSSIGNSQIFDNGTNVLIGSTTDFGQKLQVTGGAKITGIITLGMGADSYVYDSGGSLILQTGASARLTINSAGNTTLSGTLNGTSATFSGLITSTLGNNTVLYNSASATTGFQYFNIQSTNARLVFGIEANSSASILTGTSNNAGVLGTLGANPLQFGTNGVVRLTLDPSGNLGLGVTPSAWGAGKAIEIGNIGNSVWGVNTTQFNVLQNAYFDSGYKYASSTSASYYQQASGAHAWYNAPSGTAGNAITFTQAMTLDASGRLGIGTTSPVKKVDIISSTSEQLRLAYDSSGTTYTDIRSDSAGGLLVNTSGGYIINYIAGSPIMRMNANGNVLIGTTTDAGYKLDVNGTGRFSGSVDLYKNNSTDTILKVQNGTNAYASIFQLVTNNDGGAAYSSINLTTNGGTTHWQIGGGGAAANTLPFYTGGVKRLEIASTGAATFSSLGTGTVYSNGGTLTNTNPSDKNLKTEIQDLSYGLNEIMQLRPVSYLWKDDKINQGKQFGFIAQEVQEVMPDLVKEGDYLGLDKEAIFVTLINAIKELNEKITKLETK